jgi:hypothetical protein
MVCSRIRRCLMAAVCILSLLGCVTAGFAQDHRSISFHVPESTGTYPLSINDAMTVTGYYTTQAGVSNGFVRYEDGNFDTFSVPGSLLTMPVSINTAGTITGYYTVANTQGPVPQIPQGFVRTADGTITTFGNTANTDNDSSFWAQPVAINVAGEIVGNFPDITFASLAFVRSSTGTVQSFSLSIGASYPTVATSVNAGGSVIGYASSESILFAQGFLWDGQGPPPDPFSSNFTTITVPNSTGTFPTGINAEETIVGCYSSAGVYYDFVRHHDGVYTTLDVPGTVPACVISGRNLGFFDVDPPAITINDEGAVTGYFTNAAKVTTGFFRCRRGNVKTFSHPGATLTMPTSINNLNAITGYYTKGSETKGFIRLAEVCHDDEY